MVALTKSMCWKVVARTVDSSGIGLVIYQKPVSPSCYEKRKNNNYAPLCDQKDGKNSSWYISKTNCLSITLTLLQLFLMLLAHCLRIYFLEYYSNFIHICAYLFYIFVVGMCLSVIVFLCFRMIARVTCSAGPCPGPRGLVVNLQAYQQNQVPKKCSMRTQNIGLTLYRMFIWIILP